MKSFTFLFAFLLPIFCTAQQTSGKVIYTETVKLKIELDDDNEEMKKMLPTSDSFSKELVFNESEGIYQDVDMADLEDLEIKQESEGMNFKMVMKRPESNLYTNLDEGKTINSKEFFGRYFLINGEPKKLAWKMTGEQKKVLGYACQKATFQDSTRTVEAWFAPQIPVSLGPNDYNGLPGLILEINLDNGDRTMVASKVDLKELEKDAITKPTKGKEVTQAEFDKIQAEKMKEMEAEMGGSGSGGGGMKIIIKN